MLIKLEHGRMNPDEEMDERGFDGPLLGPFKEVRPIYLNTIRVTFTSGEVRHLPMFDDMVVFDNRYYGKYAVVDPNPREAIKTLPPKEGQLSLLDINPA